MDIRRNFCSWTLGNESLTTWQRARTGINQSETTSTKLKIKTSLPTDREVEMRDRHSYVENHTIAYEGNTSATNIIRIESGYDSLSLGSNSLTTFKVIKELLGHPQESCCVDVCVLDHLRMTAHVGKIIGHERQRRFSTLG